ncbi:MAG: cupin domain-containing protein [Actinomycetes bacterium]
MSAPPLTANAQAELTAELEDWGPREGADSGQPQMSGRIFFEGGGVQVGVWECTPGGWAIENRPDHETVQILAGRARLTDREGSSVELTPGDVLTLPKGWSGRWDILETVRKLYVIAE